MNKEFVEFNRQLSEYLTKQMMRAFFRFESGKDLVTGALYRKRGKYTQPFLHASMMTILFFGMAFGPQLVQTTLAEGNRSEMVATGDVLGESLTKTSLITLESDKPPSTVTNYSVKEGDTLSGMAEKFGVSIDTIKWANPDANWTKLKPGTVVAVPPVTGIVYKVKPGDTIYTIAKKFSTEAQGVVDFPFNTFSNDETFAIVAGQTLIIPDGVMPDEPVVAPRFAKVLTPDAGSVSATGNFGWPAFGRITQPFRYYHPGIDIANHDGGAIVASDAGTVVIAGWTNVGYGNYVVIDHGNGYQTLYGHLSSLAVVVGQRVSRGAIIGQMGSTGRSTGTHLHFEIHGPNGKVDPMRNLK